MDNKSNYKYLLSDLTALKGVGVKTTNLLKKKKINNIFDLLWKLPKSYTDRSLSSKIKDLRIGEVQTITIIPKKYSFPRVRNLPNRVLCSDETGEIDCIFFKKNTIYFTCFITTQNSIWQISNSWKRVFLWDYSNCLYLTNS